MEAEVVKKRKGPLGFAMHEFIYIVFSVVVCIVIITVPLWGGHQAIGVYPVFFLVWLVLNIAAAIYHLIFVYVLKKGGEENDD